MQVRPPMDTREGEPKPQPLELNTRRARGSVREGGRIIPSPKASSAYRSCKQEQRMEQARLEGLTHRLPPDRPTMAALHRQRVSAHSPSPRRAGATMLSRKMNDSIPMWLARSSSSMVPLPSSAYTRSNALGNDRAWWSCPD